MKRIFIYCLLCGIVFSAKAQDKPKLVVGIVVDQMRYDYLYAFAKRYTANGFKRLLKEGFVFHNAHFNYVPTYTGPGHASIYAGSTPSSHGIIANDWPDKTTGKNIYCTSDSTVSTVGTTTLAGKQSPHYLLSTNIADELRLATNKQSKVVGIALKDRSSIMPAGHMPTGAYWFDDSIGNWITSSYYTKELPAWVKTYNDKKTAEKYLSQNWNTLFSIETYTNAWGDTNRYEKVFAGEKSSAFPHPLAQIRKENHGSFNTIKFTPFGCTITTELAMEAIKAEELGKDEITDLLCISYSSPDYVGHYYGIRSIEMEDIYLRLDRELEMLFQFLDKQVGKGQYTVFL
ncbi:MAG: alkaline phosphatase family protein, partial [Flavobacteriales bacterium]